LPVFNHKKYLFESINSVLNQSYQNIRLIVLNDGSTEDLNAILNPYLNHSKVEVHTQENQGLSATLTKLYERSLNSTPFPTYITWHSADNIYSKTAIEELVRYLERNPDVDLAYSNVRVINAEGQPFYNSNYRLDDQTPGDTSVLNLDYCFESICEFNDNFVNACFLIRSEVEAILPKFEDKNRGFEDFVHLLQLRIFSKGSHIKIKEPLYSYRLHEETLTSELCSNDLADSQKDFVERTNFITKELADSKFLFSISSSSTENSKNISNNEISQLTTELRGHVNDLELILKPKFTQTQSEIIPKSKQTDICITKTHNFTHESHDSLFCISPLRISFKNGHSLLKDNILFTGLVKMPKKLTRARNRNLKMFDSETNYSEKFLLFAPTQKDTNLIDKISEFIKENVEKLIVLLCESNQEKEVADQVYLKSACPVNLRIIQIPKDESKNTLDNNTFLNCLGSIDSIISISNFTSETNQDTNFFNSDIVAEFIIANLTARQLVVPRAFLESKDYVFLNSPMVFVRDLQNLTIWKNFHQFEPPVLDICDKALKQFSYPDSIQRIIAASFCYSI